jgi:orotidine-5'-phosphate decarboxylase
MSFRDKYEAAASRNGSLLCVGLDPEAERLPAGVPATRFLQRIIEATADLVCCFKPNAAFFEQRGAEGWRDLRATIDAVPAAVPVLLDAKRGDVGHSAAAYARAAFDELGADAITLNPWGGADAVEPFLAYEDRHSFVWCRSSNPGAGELQDLQLADGTLLYERLAERAVEWNTRGNVGLVVGATYPEQAARLRELAPELLMLLPGVGAQQGGVAAAVRASVDARGGGILVTASRSVLYAGEAAGASDLDGYAEAAREAAQALREQIDAALPTRA